jgi:hypothetical protein
MMQKNHITVFLIVIIFSLFACSKKETPSPPTPPPPTPTEENLVFSIDPDPGAGNAIANAENYAFTVKVSSKMPSLGVKLDLSTKKESDNTMVDSKSIESSTADIPVTTGKLVVGTVYIVKVTVTSKSKSTNSVSKEFKVARKS